MSAKIYVWKIFKNFKKSEFQIWFHWKKNEKSFIDVRRKSWYLLTTLRSKSSLFDLPQNPQQLHKKLLFPYFQESPRKNIYLKIQKPHSFFSKPTAPQRPQALPIKDTAPPLILHSSAKYYVWKQTREPHHISLSFFPAWNTFDRYCIRIRVVAATYASAGGYVTFRLRRRRYDIRARLTRTATRIRRVDFTVVFTGELEFRGGYMVTVRALEL